MKEVFRALVGLLALVALVQVIKFLIQTHAPVFEFLDSAINGLVFTIGILGMIIIFRSVTNLLFSPLSNEK